VSTGDPVRPFHAKDPAKGQEAADAVKAVMQHAAERQTAAQAKAPPRRQPAKWLLPLGINLGVLALYLLIAPPPFVTLNPIEPPDLARQEESLRLAIYLQSQRIEAYRQRTGSLPVNLSDLQSSVPPGVEYRLQDGGRYLLMAMLGDSTIVYDSTQSAADFVGTAAAALREG